MSSKYTSKTFLPMLAVAVLGMAVMVGVVSDSSRNFNPSSNAGSKGECMRFSDSFKKLQNDIWINNGVNEGISEVFVNDKKLTITQLGKNKNYDSAGIQSQSILRGDYTTSLEIATMIGGENLSTAELAVHMGGSENATWISIKKQGADKYYVHTLSRKNNVNAKEVDTKLMNLKFPVELIISREGTNFKTYYREKGKDKVQLGSYDNLWGDPMKANIMVYTEKPNYPDVKAVFSDFKVGCK